MLGTIGDLIEDVVVVLGAPIAHAADTPAAISRRRGGSAANTAAVAARLSGHSRLIASIGDDRSGHALVDELRGEGVDVVRRVVVGGRTGAIVVLVEPGGERTMLTDRAAATALADPDPAWLDGLSVLHVPLYSLVGEPIAGTTRALLGWAHDRGIPVSIDASSASELEALGAATAGEMIAAAHPRLLLCNADEHAALGGVLTDHLDRAGVVLVVKHGAAPTLLRLPGGRVAAVPVPPIGEVRDTTGAGDAFAAGMLTRLFVNGASVDDESLTDSVHNGHAAARAAILRASAT